MNRLGKLKACLEFFDIQNMETFGNRFKVQKYIYFAIRFGLNLDFTYNLYKRGPYSPSLASAAFSILEEADDIFLIEDLTSDEQEILQHTKKFVEELSDEDLEVLTTLDFLHYNNYKQSTRSEIEQKLHRLKDWTKGIPRETLDEYWQHLEDYKLVDE